MKHVRKIKTKAGYLRPERWLTPDESQARDAYVMRRREDGATIQVIANEIQYSVPTVHGIIKRLRIQAQAQAQTNVSATVSITTETTMDDHTRNNLEDGQS